MDFKKINNVWQWLAGALAAAILTILLLLRYFYPYRGYNPGLITTIFILIPYCTFVIGYVILAGVFTPLDWILGIGSGLAIPGILFMITGSCRKQAEKIHPEA